MLCVPLIFIRMMKWKRWFKQKVKWAQNSSDWRRERPTFWKLLLFGNCFLFDTVYMSILKKELSLWILNIHVERIFDRNSLLQLQNKKMKIFWENFIYIKPLYSVSFCVNLFTFRHFSLFLTTLIMIIFLRNVRIHLP